MVVFVILFSFVFDYIWICLYLFKKYLLKNIWYLLHLPTGKAILVVFVIGAQQTTEMPWKSIKTQPWEEIEEKNYGKSTSCTYISFVNNVVESLFSILWKSKQRADPCPCLGSSIHSLWLRRFPTSITETETPQNWKLNGGELNSSANGDVVKGKARMAPGDEGDGFHKMVGSFLAMDLIYLYLCYWCILAMDLMFISVFVFVLLLSSGSSDH